MMTLHIDIQTSPGGSSTPIDLVDLRIAQIKLDVRYRQPAALTFVMYQPQQSLPLGINNFLRFWDDAAHDSAGNSFSAGNPIFEGFIDQVSPGDDAHLVSITCQDPTQKTSKEIPIMSTAWQPGSPPS